MALDVFRVKSDELYWIGVLFNDITQRKKTESQQAFLLRLCDELRPQADALNLSRLQ